jgi:general secretion pathway protein G
MYNHDMKKRPVHFNEEGWTYVETLIVIGIVIILSGTVGFLGLRYVEKARLITAKSEIENLSLALNSYYIDCQDYPTEAQGLSALWTKPTSEPVSENWNGPYLSKEDFSDPWGNEYVYTVPGPNKLPFGIKSLGADKAEGGDGKNSDIVSWE